MPDRELGRQRRDDRGGKRAELLPRDVLAAVLLGERAADVVFGSGAALEQKGTDAPAGESLDGQGAVDALLAHGAGANQQDTQSRHALTDYRVPGVETSRPFEAP